MANDISGRIAQLKQKQEQLARRLNALEQKEKSQTRKLDTRRKIIVGGAVVGGDAQRPGIRQRPPRPAPALCRPPQ